MRDDLEEPRGGINPLKIGIIGAVVIAVLVAGVLQFRSYSQNKAAQLQQQVSLQDDLAKAKKENKDLEKQLAALKDKSETSQSKLEKMLKLKESQIVSTIRLKDSESRSADAKIAQLNKQNDQLAAQIAELKKEADLRAQDLKKAQDQAARIQAELKASRTDADRFARDAKVLQAKLNKINEGDDAAADQMVQQLSEARQQLKREQAARQRLQEEVDSLKQTQPKPQ